MQCNCSSDSDYLCIFHDYRYEFLRKTYIDAATVIEKVSLMKTLSTSVAALMMACAMPAFADVINPGLLQMVSELDAQDAIMDPVWYDLDADGFTDLVLTDATADADGLHTWQIYDGESAESVFVNASRNPVLVAPMADDTGLVVVDDIKWSWNGYKVIPDYDIVRENISFLSPPTNDDVAALAAVGYVDVLRDTIEVLRSDIVDNPGRERLVTITDDMYQEADFATPWFIFTEDDKLILAGTSIFHPVLYKRAEGGLIVIQDREEGMSISEFTSGDLPQIYITAPNFEGEKP
jgi:hypothetical protein